MEVPAVMLAVAPSKLHVSTAGFLLDGRPPRFTVSPSTRRKTPSSGRLTLLANGNRAQQGIIQVDTIEIVEHQIDGLLTGECSRGWI